MQELHNTKPHRQVVVTGLGLVSGLGHNVETYWRRLKMGESAVHQQTCFDSTGLPSTLAADVKDFNVENGSPLASLGRASQMAIVAANSAVLDAGLPCDEVQAVFVGTTIGECQEFEVCVQHGLNNRQISFEQLAKTPDCVLASNVGRELGVDQQASVALIPTACAAGNYAIAYAYDVIQQGLVDVALVGGVDGFSHIAYIGFSRLFALAKQVCRPFDRRRDGIVVGEGAGMLVLESEGHAKRRGKQPYAYVNGVGYSCDATHPTTPDGDGVKQVMSAALNNADLQPEDINLICAHGTGTVLNDKTESDAINAVFPNKPYVNSIKSMIGHAMGAASALEAIACILSVYHQGIPGTINSDPSQLDCDINLVTKSQNKTIDYVLNNAFAFGGNNCSVIFGVKPSAAG